MWKLMSPTKPRFLIRVAKSVQILNWSAMESIGSEVGNDAVGSSKLRHCAQVETKVVGLRSLTDETPCGIEIPRLSNEFNSISCDSSILLYLFCEFFEEFEDLCVLFFTFFLDFNFWVYKVFCFVLVFEFIEYSLV